MTGERVGRLFRRQESLLLQVARRQGELLGMMERIVTVMEEMVGVETVPPSHEPNGEPSEVLLGANPAGTPPPSHRADTSG